MLPVDITFTPQGSTKLWLVLTVQAWAFNALSGLCSATHVLFEELKNQAQHTDLANSATADHCRLYVKSSTLKSRIPNSGIHS